MEGDLPGVQRHRGRGGGRILGDRGSSRRGLILRQAQPRRWRWDPRGAGSFGDEWRAAPVTHKLPQPRVLTRLISASLFSCRALSKPNAFPPGRNKEGAREAGSPWARARARFPRAADPAVRPVRTGGRRETPRARAGGRWTAGWGRSSAGTTVAPTLKPVAERDRHGVHPAREAPRRRRRRGTWRRDRHPAELRWRVAAEPRGGGKARAAGHTPPSPPGRRPSPMPGSLHQSGYYAGRRARRRPLCWRTRKMHGAVAAHGHLSAPPGTWTSPFPTSGPRFPRK